MFKNSKKSKFFYRILSRRKRFFTAYSVDVGDFYRILSTRSIIFAAHSVGVEYFLAHTQSAEKNQNGESQIDFLL